MSRMISKGAVNRKTIQKDFREFIRLCKKWQKIFAIEYTLYFEHCDLKDRGFQAQAIMNKQSGKATIQLGFVVNDSLDQIALHETLHLVLGRYRREASPFLGDMLLEEIEHEIISKIENYIFK